MDDQQAGHASTLSPYEELDVSSLRRESVLDMYRLVFGIVCLALLSACGGSSDQPVKHRSAAVLNGSLWDDSSAGCKTTTKRLQAADYLLKQFEDEKDMKASVAYYKRASSYLILANRECFSKAQVSSAQGEFDAVPSKTLKEDLAAGEQ